MLKFHELEIVLILCQWAPPTNSSQSQLKLYNSLTRSKVK